MPLTDVRPPDRLQAVVHVAGSGEFFWPRDEAGEAARWLTSLGAAIIGGEGYRRFPGFWATYVAEWDTVPPWLPSEAWSTYAERGLSQALEKVARGRDADLFFFAHSFTDEYAMAIDGTAIA